MLWSIFNTFAAIMRICAFQMIAAKLGGSGDGRELLRLALRNSIQSLHTKMFMVLHGTVVSPKDSPRTQKEELKVETRNTPAPETRPHWHQSNVSSPSDDH